VRCDEQPSQSLGGSQCGQRLLMVAARELQPPANVMEQQPGGRFDLLVKRALCVLQARLCLLEPSLGERRGG
jgi:hypothetical protein